MSIIFGIANVSGQVTDKRHLADLAHATRAHAPDGTSLWALGPIGMGFQAYRTHQRSSLEVLPLIDECGNVLAIDGRIDNYIDLCNRLGIRDDVPDSRIVLKAFEKWGEECFSHLVGEWALALWAHSERTLYLARDHAGSRSLYFEYVNGRVLWSTYLETFFAGGREAELDEDFVARYLACQPTRELTPYRDIRAVPPAHYLRVREDDAVYKAHWKWVVNDSIVYDKDAKYEEHFLQLFGQSVERRTGPGAPILAQLSGGMDSTSIVCMSDHIRRSQSPSVELLETVSFYDNSEPNWNEFPYFTAVEKSRGKSGLHIDGSFSERTIRPQRSTDSLQLWPGADSSAADFDAQLHIAVRGFHFRSILSGLGGDEVLGGVPTPFPELADFMVSGDLFRLWSCGIEWCLAKRIPLLHMLLKTLTFTYGLYVSGHSTSNTTPSWLSPRLRYRTPQGPTEKTVWDRLRCRIPSKIDNGNGWCSVIETLPTRLLSNNERFEYRYPYLDRNLVEFLFSIPTRQLVEPGRRRSLMRRALKDIVPNEILERRRKAYLIQGPLNLIRRERDWLAVQFQNLRCVDMGLVDPATLPAALDSVATKGDPKWLPYLGRLISLELWLGAAPIHIPPVRLSDAGDQDPRQAAVNGSMTRKFAPTRRTP